MRRRGSIAKLAARCRDAAGVADIPIFNASEADCDAIVQIGTALPVVALIAEIERETGKPLVACNAAVYWQTLRAIGITDPIRGYGSLLSEH